MDGEFRWISDNSSSIGVVDTSSLTADIMDLTTGQPGSEAGQSGYQNWDQRATLAESCVMARHGWQWKWQDVDCEVQLAYICEYS